MIPNYVLVYEAYPFKPHYEWGIKLIDKHYNVFYEYRAWKKPNMYSVTYNIDLQFTNFI